MKILKILIICFLIVIFFTNNTKAVEGPILVQDDTVENVPVADEQTTVQPISYIDIVKKVSFEYNQDWWLIYNICKAESHFNPNAVHDGGAGKGVCGIHKTTFIYWEDKFSIDLDYNSDYDQIKMTAIAFSNGEFYRNQFSTYLRYKTYGVFNKYEVK